jgi:integral membrane protein (TIGR01906 family)
VLAAVLLGVLFAYKKKKAVKPLCISYLWVMGAMLAAALVLGVIMLIDFSALFLKFHHLFFTNDLWLLDINTDVLIQMLPESFFNSLALSIVAYLAAFILIPTAVSIGYLVWRKKKYA